MIKLKPFELEDWKYISKWISNEIELIQFAGQIFTFPIDKIQIELYLSDTNRIVFRIEDEKNRPIGMAEISVQDKNVAKLARILIGEKSMRGKGIGAELINQLTKFGFKKLNKDKIRLNVYKWNVGAIRCYEKVGFVQTNRPIKYVTVGNEVWETIEMEKQWN